jgi:hypothetical protein
MSYLSNSGGDPNNLGYFATPAALEAAFPIGFPGAFAVVGSTDTVWVWDENTMMWVDTGHGGVGGVSFYTPSGTVNGTNASFGVTSSPSSVIADGITSFLGAGFTYSAPNIIMAIPPSEYIRYTL